MPRLLRSLRNVGCRKPDCCTGSGTLQRHHKRHQAMWIGIWIGRRKDETEFKELVRIYWSFRPQDIVLLCDWHHAEVHKLYDGIIQEFKHKLGRPLYKATWTEAEELMQLLEAACEQWLSEVTPGYDPRLLRIERMAQKIGARVTPKSKKRRKRHGRKNRAKKTGRPVN